MLGTSVCIERFWRSIERRTTLRKYDASSSMASTLLRMMLIVVIPKAVTTPTQTELTLKPEMISPAR